MLATIFQLSGGILLVIASIFTRYKKFLQMPSLIKGTADEQLKVLKEQQDMDKDLFNFFRNQSLAVCGASFLTIGYLVPIFWDIELQSVSLTYKIICILVSLSFCIYGVWVICNRFARFCIQQEPAEHPMFAPSTNIWDILKGKGKKK
jgi:hypothetical protein